MQKHLESIAVRTRGALFALTAGITVLSPTALLAAHPCKSASSTPGLNAALESRLAQAFNCFGQRTTGAVAGTLEACNSFVAHAVKREWSLEHFWLKDKSRFMTPEEMEEWLAIEGALRGWDLIGHAGEPDAHVQAAERAEAGKPVIALNLADGPKGRAALVLPGALHPSVNYGFPVVRIAQTGFNNPARSFLGCAFSYGFLNAKAQATVFYAYRGPT